MCQGVPSRWAGVLLPGITEESSRTYPADAELAGRWRSQQGAPGRRHTGWMPSRLVAIGAVSAFVGALGVVFVARWLSRSHPTRALPATRRRRPASAALTISLVAAGTTSAPGP